MPSNDSWAFLFQKVTELQAPALPPLRPLAEADSHTAWPSCPRATCWPSTEVQRLEFLSFGIWPKGCCLLLHGNKICYFQGTSMSMCPDIYDKTWALNTYRVLHGTLLRNVIFLQRFLRVWVSVLLCVKGQWRHDSWGFLEDRAYQCRNTGAGTNNTPFYYKIFYYKIISMWSYNNSTLLC